MSEAYPLMILSQNKDIQDVRFDMRQMNQEIQQCCTEVQQGFQSTHSRIDSHIRWMITGKISVAGPVIASAGVVVAMLKPWRNGS